MATARRLRPLDRPVDAVVAVPGSKSIANRALVCAAQAPGTSELTNVPDGDDTTAMLAGLTALGAIIVADAGRVRVGGIPDPRRIGNADVHAALAGTTSRFLTALAALGHDPVTIDGLPALRRRPFGPLHDALVQLGVRVTPGESWGHLPVTIQGPPDAGAVSIAGDVSSQYITALMLIGPSLPDGLRLELTSTLVSRPYVEMTAAVMEAFGIEGVDVGRTHVHVTPHRYATTRFEVEPDASSASYPLAVAAVRSGRVEIRGLGDRALQGDARFADLLGAMGCTVERRADTTVVSRAAETSLRGIDVDMADVSDLVPTVAAVAMFADTPTRISGVGFIRGKESDRLGDLARELGALGGAVAETDDGLIVHPSRDRLHGAALGDPPRPPPGDGIRCRRHGGGGGRGRRSRRRDQELARLLADARRARAMTRTRIAAFDFDGTLTRSDSVLPFLRLVGGWRWMLRLARHAPWVIVPPHGATVTVSSRSPPTPCSAMCRGHASSRWRWSTAGRSPPAGCAMTSSPDSAGISSKAIRWSSCRRRTSRTCASSPKRSAQATSWRRGSVSLRTCAPANWTVPTAEARKRCGGSSSGCRSVASRAPTSSCGPTEIPPATVELLTSADHPVWVNEPLDSVAPASA